MASPPVSTRAGADGIGQPRGGMHRAGLAHPPGGDMAEEAAHAPASSR